MRTSAGFEVAVYDLAFWIALDGPLSREAIGELKPRLVGGATNDHAVDMWITRALHRMRDIGIPLTVELSRFRGGWDYNIPLSWIEEGYCAG